MHSLPTTTLSALLYLVPAALAADSYSLKTTYQGSTFFQQWNYSTAADLNFGFASFQSQQTAIAQKLTFVNAAGNVIVKVDNTTVGNPADSNFGRASVYMESLDSVDIGSLVLFDAVHAPTGCSVWPAFFMEGAGVTWPSKGEIDVFENVNLATTNQYSLHTLDGCTHASSAVESGTLVSSNCFNATNSNQGCIVKESQPNSFGADFNSNGGGGFAVSLTEDGINFWYFPRSKIPSDWTSSTPNPSGWGTPSASYPSSGCNIDQFFGPQTMILDIDICGSFAGDGGAFAQTCSGSCVDLLKTPTNYDQAYFEIQFIKVFTLGGSNATTTTGGATVSKTSIKSTGTSTNTAVHSSGAASLSASVPFVFSSSALMMLGSVAGVAIGGLALAL